MSSVEKMVLEVGDIPPIPAVATKVLALLNDHGTTAETLARTIEADPAVAARIIKISNSPYYGAYRQIQTLPAAIVTLGLNTLRSLVVTAAVSEAYKPFGLMEKMLWEHSMGAAVAARIIAASVPQVNKEEAYLVGLFHDIGKVIMHAKDPAKFQALVQLCYNEERPFAEVESTMYPYTHPEVGGYVIRQWNFPEALVVAVERHHDLAFPDEVALHDRQLTAVAAMGHAFCSRLGIGQRFPSEGSLPIEERAAQILGLEQERTEELIEVFRESYENSRSSFV